MRPILPLILSPLVLVLVTPNIQSQGYRIYEAEDCRITCEAGLENQGNMWASGGLHTPAYWGRAEGDTIQWRVRVGGPADDLKLLIRYSYAHEHYTRFSGGENPDRNLEVWISGEQVGEAHVPDTGWWDIFNTAVVELPPLEAGDHSFGIRSPVPHSCTNIDCIILLRGDIDQIPAAMRCTDIASSETGHYIMRATAGVTLRFDPEATLEEFEQIYDHFEEYMGWEPPNPVTVNIIADDVWPNPGAASFQNQWGVFFPESTFLTDRGNWLHEMTHMFYCAHFPWWFDESSVRALTTFVWAPALLPNHQDDNPYLLQCREEGIAVLDNPNRRFGPAEPIQYAMIQRYGPEVFSRFFHLCQEAGESEEIDFTPGRHLTNDEIVRFMSQAAGEDVSPIYQQWEGL